MSLRYIAPGQQPDEHTALAVTSSSIIAAGLTAATIAAITSKFGWPGTLFGVVFIGMFTTTTTKIYEGYLNKVVRRGVLLVNRPPPPPLGTLADRPLPPPLDPTSRALRLPRHIRVLAALKWFAFRASPEIRRWILSRGLQAGVVACIIAIGVVTVVELWVGGNLSCYLWQTDCSPEGNPPSILAPFYTICRG
jgi:hypothetical protein